MWGVRERSFSSEGEGMREEGGTTAREGIGSSPRSEAVLRRFRSHSCHICVSALHLLRLVEGGDTHVCLPLNLRRCSYLARSWV